MEESDFAIQWLDYLDVEIYNKGQRIFLPPKLKTEYLYEVKPLLTQIRVGEVIGEVDEDKKDDYLHMTYPELENLGYGIYLDVNFRWKQYQKGSYRIIKKKSNVTTLGYDSYRKSASQSNMIIQHDPTKHRIRLLGNSVYPDPDKPISSGVGPWIVYDEDARQNESSFNPFDDISDLDSLFSGEKKEKEPVYKKIKEIPILITEDNYIVCIDKEDTCQRVLVVGGSGQGKSLLVNSMAHRIFMSWGDRVGWLIDPLNQLYNLMLPQDNPAFNKRNSWICNEPMPLPVIVFYLACKNILPPQHKNVSMLLTLDFREFLNKYKFYTHGIKEYDVGNTIRYLNDVIQDLQHAKNAENVKDIMYRNIPKANDDKGLQAMIYKWVNTMDTIFKDKFTSNLYVDDPFETHELTVKFPDGTQIKGHPFIMAMEAGLIPVINVALAKREKIMRNYLADIMQKLVSHQVMLQGKKHRMWIIADELNMIYEEKSGIKKDNAAQSFEELFRQGRFNNIGFIGNTQSLTKLNPEMYANATHIICVNMQKAIDRKLVGTSMDLKPEEYEQIGALKQQEVFAISRIHPFVVYDRWGRREVSRRTWFKGKLFPPFNYHTMPGKEP